MSEDEIIETVARQLARVHFMRKQHPISIKTQRVAYLVNKHWRNHVPDACAALVAIRDVLKAIKAA